MLLLVAVLLTACHSGDESGNSAEEDCYLEIYVYAPDRPIVTRGDVGEVKPADAESRVHTLQIWVFKSGNGNLVGYHEATPTYLNGTTGQEMYRMKVAKAFADAPEAVDVYVVANTASCGLTFSETTSRDDLDSAKIGKETPVVGETYFGPDEKVSAVPTGGLPMSAVLKNQPIHGSFPALRIGTQNQMSILRLTRAVSKLRFVLCQIKNNTSDKKLESIDGISLSENQIPDNTWLIARETNGYTCSHGAINYLSSSIAKADIPEVDDPLTYVYATQTAQEYEDLIDAAINNEEDGVKKPLLKEVGLTYLRESDKQLTGTIRYTIRYTTTEKPEEVTFSMAAPGDFLRNHSWIVYIYYLGKKIHVHVVTHIGMKSWTSDNNDDNLYIYNW